MVHQSEAGQVREWVAKCREFPVEHGYDTEFGFVENHIVNPEITVHDAGRLILFLAWNVARKPLDQSIHACDWFGLGGLVLLRPSFDLSLVVIAREFREFLETNLARIKSVQPGQDLYHLLIDLFLLFWVKTGQVLVHKDSSIYVFHQVEFRANYVGIRAVMNGPWHWKILLEEC